MKKAFIYWLPLVVYSAVIIYLSIDPEPPQADIVGLDKVFHFLAYAVMGALSGRAIASAFGSGADKRRVIVISAFAFSFIFGFLMEVWQSFIPERSAEVLDMIANGAGGLFGAFVFSRFIKKEALR
ncbi:MAG: VanZ family protein [Deltaproteobacteria bacterium]|nr:VanZ family protein [Deltaproteobacteria bacterium]